MSGIRFRRLCSFLLIILCLAGLTACAGGDTGAGHEPVGQTGEEAKIRLQFLMANEANRGNVLVSQFKEPYEATHPGVEIVLNFSDTKQLFDKLLSMLAANAGPDAVSLNSLIELSTLGDGKTLIPLDKLAVVAGVDLDAYDLSTLISIRETGVDGKLYMLPDRLLVDMLAYNRKMFEHYQVPPPKVGLTLEDLYQKALLLREKMAEAGDDQKDIRPFTIWAPGKLYTKIMQTYGVYMYDYFGEKTNLDTDISRKAMAYEYSLYAGHLVLPQPEAGIKGYGSTQDLFPQGFSAMMLETGWTMTRIMSETAKPGARYATSDFDVVPWPVFAGDKPRRPSRNCTGYGVTKDSENPVEAVRAVAYLCNEVENRTADSGIYELNARTRSTSNAGLLKQFPGLKSAWDLDPAPQPSRIGEIEKKIDTVIKQSFDQASIGQLSLEQLRNRIQKESQHILTDYKANLK